MICLQILIFLLSSAFVDCKVYEEGVCYNATDNFNNIELFFDTATCQNYSYEYYCTLDEETQNWFYALYRDAMSEMSSNAPPRKRREIRTLTETERNKYFNAINALKNDKGIKPNKYEAIALIHTNQTLCSVHRGTNFLGWHRIFLLIYETALRQKDNSLTLPYWDSVIDNNNITEPTSSIIFTDTFVGNGDGFVVSGPFANWTDSYNCTLVRHIGDNNYTLMSPKIIDELQNDLAIHHMEQVTYQGSSDAVHTIEGQHNRLHNWVGGMMGVLDDSPQDPIFFMHHAFIDYTWEKFRQKQERMQVNAETDYPIHGHDVKRHLPNKTMDCFHWMRNIEGLSNNFSHIVTYEPSPTCPWCGNSSFLKCNITLNRCISKHSNYNFSPPESPSLASMPCLQKWMTMVSVVMSYVLQFMHNTQQN